MCHRPMFLASKADEFDSRAETRRKISRPRCAGIAAARSSLTCAYICSRGDVFIQMPNAPQYELKIENSCNRTLYDGNPINTLYTCSLRFYSIDHEPASSPRPKNVLQIRRSFLHRPADPVKLSAGKFFKLHQSDRRGNRLGCNFRKNRLRPAFCASREPSLSRANLSPNSPRQKTELFRAYA